MKVASASPTVRVGDPFFNAKEIIKTLAKIEDKASFVVFPELAISGYSVGDLIFQDYLYEASIKALSYLLKNNPYNGIIIIGSMYKHNNVMYNCSYVIQKNQILGIVPKTYLPHSHEHYEARWFNSGLRLMEEVDFVHILGQDIPFGKIIFSDLDSEVKFGVEVCADLWSPISPHENLYANGALLVFNNSASSDYVGKAESRRLITKAASYKWNGAYIYSSTSKTESTSDVVFSGHKIIAVNGEIVSEADSLSSDEEIIYGDIDISYLNFARVNNSWYKIVQDQLRDPSFKVVKYSLIKTKGFIFEKEMKITICSEGKEWFSKIIDIQAASIKSVLNISELVMLY